MTSVVPAADSSQGWGAIQHAVSRSPDLSPEAKALFAILVSHDGARGCFPSQATLGRELHRSTRSIQRYLRELERAGFVSSIRTGRMRTNRYVLDRPRPSEPARELASSVGDATPASCPRKNNQWKSHKKRKREPVRSSVASPSEQWHWETLARDVSQTEALWHSWGEEEHARWLLAVFNRIEGTSYAFDVWRELLIARARAYAKLGPRDLETAIEVGLSQRWLSSDPAWPTAVFKAKSFDAALNGVRGRRRRSYEDEFTRD